MTKKEGRGGEIAQGKAKDAGGLTPANDDNAALRDCYPRTFARNSDDCYRSGYLNTGEYKPRTGKHLCGAYIVPKPVLPE